MLALSRGIMVVALLLLPLGAARAASDLETILKEWELAALRIHRLDCDFTRYRYNWAIEIERRGTGSLAVDRTGRAYYKIGPAGIRPGEIGRKMGRDGDRFELQVDRAERWHWTGDSVIRVDEVERIFEEIPLVARTMDGEFRPEPPALPEDELSADGDARAAGAGQNRVNASTKGSDQRLCPMSVREAIVELITVVAIYAAVQNVDWTAVSKSIHESIQEFWLTRPFLIGMPADELRQRFHIELSLIQSEDVICLRFKPKTKRDQASFSRAILILTKEQQFPDCKEFR